MNIISEFLIYVIEQRNEIFTLLFQHIRLTVFSVIFSIMLGVPLGILIKYVKKLNKPILGFANIVQAIPSMALLGISIPILGIGSAPAIFMVILYSLLPIIKNTYTGLSNISPQILEAAKGIGLTKTQRLFKIQIPLSLPVIMAGIRVSAVTSVGLMTIAAYVGAGGLGYLVFAGIRTINNYQILAGAIPACLLALLVDYVFSIIERLVTPISLQANETIKRKELEDKRKKDKIIIYVVIIIALILSATQIIKLNINKRDTITVSSLMFTEQLILGNMVSDLIEANTDLIVDRKLALGGTQIVFQALDKGDVDLYVDYTGTMFASLLNYNPTNDSDFVYNIVKKDMKSKYNIETLEPFNFNNTYVLAIRKETKERYNIKTISDMRFASKNLKFCGTIEFMNRADGIIGLTNFYLLDFKDYVAIDDAPRYIALDSKEVDVITAFSTDGLLKKFSLITLEDNKNFFPPYYAVPFIRADTLNKYPEISKILKKLGDLLDEKTMIELNYQVDEMQKDPKEVAREFLIKNNLI